MNYKKNPQQREQRVQSSAEAFVQASFWERAMKFVNDYFTPKSAEEMKDGHRARHRAAWLNRKRATGAAAKRIRMRRAQKRARRITRQYA